MGWLWARLRGCLQEPILCAAIRIPVISDVEEMVLRQPGEPRHSIEGGRADNVRLSDVQVRSAALNTGIHW